MEVLSPRELEARLRAIGAERYHNKHPFHELMNGGKLRRGLRQFRLDLLGRGT